MTLRVIQDRTISEEPIDIPRCIATHPNPEAIDEYLVNPAAALLKYDPVDEDPVDEDPVDEDPVDEDPEPLSVEDAPEEGSDI